jgi:hypothetical protein
MLRSGPQTNMNKTLRSAIFRRFFNLVMRRLVSHFQLVEENSYGFFCDHLVQMSAIPAIGLPSFTVFVENYLALPCLAHFEYQLSLPYECRTS